MVTAKILLTHHLFILAITLGKSSRQYSVSTPELICEMEGKWPYS